MTYKVSKLIRKKRIHKKYKNTRHPAYLKISKQVKAEVKHSKIQFETKLAENIKEDKKSFFAYIRSKAKANTYPGPLLNSEGKLVETPIEIANKFNCYFCSVFTTENMSNLSQLHEGSALQNSTESQLEDMIITYEQTYKKLKDIRKDKSQ